MTTKPYICLVCDRYFSRADLFEHHMDTKYHRKRAEKYQHPDHPWQAPELGQELDPQHPLQHPPYETGGEEYHIKSVTSPTHTHKTEAGVGAPSESYFVYHKQPESTYYYPSQPVYAAPGHTPRGVVVPQTQNIQTSPTSLQNNNLSHSHLSHNPNQTYLAHQPMLMSQHHQQVYPWLPSQANPIHYV
ncbi:hypothetical protein CJU90_6020 [Yarrowia sp. C11]|nr:hypothetical protein CJU90_6020 [Yarrowia sp. C11]